MVTTRMMARRLVFTVLLYVCADLSNPFMPGAFCFSPDQSVEVTGGAHHGRRPLAVSSSRVKVDTPERARLSYRGRSEHRAGAPTAAFDEWFVDLRRAHTPFHAPPSPGDDH